MEAAAMLTIDMHDYLTEDRITEICEEELRYSLRKQLEKEADIDRILSNRSYEYLFKLVQEELGLHEEKFRKMLVDRCEYILTEDGTLRYEVFRRKDAWNRTESVAVKYLDEALEECKPKIVEAIDKVIEDYPFYELQNEILDSVYECIERKLFSK